MLKKIFFSTFILFINTSVFAQTLTESDYLKLNAQYTEKLINFVLTEETQLKKLDELKKIQKQAETDSRLAQETLASTSNSLVAAQNKLVELEDKKLNKVQIETDLKSEKTINSDSINQLNGQITSLGQDIQELNTEISKLDNSKALVLNKIETKDEIRALINRNIESLEDSIDKMNSDIRSNERDIRSLNNEIDRLKSLRDAALTPEEKQGFQNQIEQARTEKQSLENLNRTLQSTISNEELVLVNERSKLRQNDSEIRILNVELQGFETQIASLAKQKRSLESSSSSLKSNRSKLTERNKSIDLELVVLNNLPQEISKTNSLISTLTTNKTQQTTLATKKETEFKTAQSNTVALQTKIETEKKNLMALEETHNLTLAEFLKQLPASSTPASPSSLGIESVIVTTPLLQSKDWSVFKGTSATLDSANICAASTRTLDKVTGSLSELLVFKIVNKDGSFSTPLVMTTFSSNPDSVFSGVLKTDRRKAVQLALFQSPVALEKALIASYKETQSLIANFKADNRATVDFVIPGSKTTVQFSLRGSSVALNEFTKSCKN